MLSKCFELRGTAFFNCSLIITYHFRVCAGVSGAILRVIYSSLGQCSLESHPPSALILHLFLLSHCAACKELKKKKKKDKKTQGHEQPWCIPHVPGDALGPRYKSPPGILTTPCEKDIIVTPPLKNQAQEGDV